MPREIITAASAPTSWVLGLFLEVLGLVDDVLLVVGEDEFLEVVAFVVGEEVPLKEVLDRLLVLSVELVCGDETGVDEVAETLGDVELLVEFVVVSVEVVVSVVVVVTGGPDELVVLGVLEAPFEVLGLLLTVLLLLVQIPPRSARKIERTQRVFICKGGRQIKITL